MNARAFVQSLPRFFRGAYLTAFLVAATLAVFAFELTRLDAIDALFFDYGIVARRWRWAFRQGWGEFFTLLRSLLSSLFLHGGALHLFANMLYLILFGPAVERRLGFVRFLVLYLLCGLSGAAIHLLLHSGSEVPLVGASAAVAGVLGAYLLLFPRTRMAELIPRLPKRLREHPAALFLGLWFVLLWLQGLAGIGDVVNPGRGVLWVHMAGFLSGMVGAVLLFPIRKT